MLMSVIAKHLKELLCVVFHVQKTVPVTPQEIASLPRAYTYDCFALVEFEVSDLTGALTFNVGGLTVIDDVVSIVRYDRGLIIKPALGKECLFRIMMPRSWRTMFVEDVQYQITTKEP